jgi:methionine synthase I (cobalamin-dependent)
MDTDEKVIIKEVIVYKYYKSPSSKECQKNYVVRNPDKIKEIKRRYYENNKEVIKEKQRLAYAKKKENNNT